MNEIKKILAALAPSKERAEEIFNYAAKLTASLNAELIVANVINSRDVEAISKIVSLGYEVDGDHYVQDVREERKQMIAQIINKSSSLPPGSVRTIFKVGNPINELLKIIISENVDIVVMGPKGRTDLEHVILGSVAEKMFRRSPVPILSYRDEKCAKRLKKAFV